MKKRILITTGMERNTRILLRTELFELLKTEYDLVIASPAEMSQNWKDEFKDVIFFSDILVKENSNDVKGTLEKLGVSAIVACSNSDVPAHSFDVNFQKISKSLNIPVIIVQDFIDAIFHPMVVTPDLYLCWGEFFKRMYSRKRDVQLWHPIGSLHGLGVEEALPNVKIVGVPHFDIYRKSEFYNRERFCQEMGFDIKKPIFTYLPNGELSQWVFDSFSNFTYKFFTLFFKKRMALKCTCHSMSLIHSIKLPSSLFQPHRVMKTLLFGFFIFFHNKDYWGMSLGNTSSLFLYSRLFKT